MGSFVGHIDEGIFFLCISWWWMWKMFPEHIAIKIRGKGKYTSQLSYRGLKNIPIETIMKILFPFCGFLGEVFNQHAIFFDKDGNFLKINSMQHMTIYGMFIIHGIIDLCMQYGVPFPKNLDYITVAMSFFWYGLSFYFHANMPGKAPLEQIVHVLPIPMMFMASAAILAEAFSQRHSAVLSLMRIYTVAVLGTYFIHISFVLYSAFPLPGSHPNPNWDQTDHRNVHFMVALFGFHLNLHIVSISLFYLICYLVTKRKLTGRWQHQSLDFYVTPPSTAEKSVLPEECNNLLTEMHSVDSDPEA